MYTYGQHAATQYDEYENNEERVFQETHTVSKINFLNLLTKEVPYEYKLRRFKVRKTPHEPVCVEIDDAHRFRNTVSITRISNGTIESLSSSSRNSGIRDFLKKKQIENELKEQHIKVFKDEKTPQAIPLEVVDWESEIFVEDPPNQDNVIFREYVNDLIDGDWESHIFIDPVEMPVYKKHMTLYIDDPNLIFEKVEEKKAKPKKKQLKTDACDKPLRSKYNISNDKYYVTDVKSKASLGTFGVQHSLPALKLDSRFYKTNHSKEELRNFHRPPMCIKNASYTFKIPSSAPKFTGNIIKKTQELSLADSAPFVIFEYFEQFPFFIMNPGMVSLLNTYYRKIDPADEPAIDGCIVLDAEEEAPFFGFGEVSPGSTIQTLTNNLFIAPIAQHKSLDFLCVIDTDDHIVMKPIDTVFVVGQELPKEEVFAPHSRKLNQFCKDRLKVAAYRLFSKGKDLLMSQLDQMFPYFSEGSKRKWLKEYSDYSKKGKDNVWTPKESFSIVGEEDLRKLVTPENICQYESMLAAERRMQDLGYKCLEEDDEEEYEMYYPNWYLSRNFVNAANSKGLLELSGPADPSGCGDAFSFRKIKLKKGNESENRRIIAEHQATYKERLSSTWNRHISMLTSTEAPVFVPTPKKSSFEMPSETTVTDNSNCLVIKRFVEEDGEVKTKIEKVYDSRVIRSYLKLRKSLKFEEKKTTFTCSSCGQSGHMRTNKSCPNYIGSTSVKSSYKKKIDEKKSAQQLLQDKMSRLVSLFMSIPFSNAFHRPVSLKKFPDYAVIVKNPIDLTTIKMKIKSGKYMRYEDFVADLRLMRDNCSLYNGPHHSLTEIADGIFTQCMQYFQNNSVEIKQLETQIEHERLGFSARQE